MKRLVITSLVLLAGISGQAMAACTGTPVTGTALSTLISNSTVCAVLGRDTWQEQHRISGALWDYKKGPGDPVDPSEQVGTWSVNTTTNTVTYNYTGGPSYSYTVYDEGAALSYCFSGGATVISGAKIKPTIGSCP